MKHSMVIIFILLLCTIDVFAKKEIIIDLTKQKLYAIKDGNITINTKISTGKEGYRTPAGKFKILEKKDIISLPYIIYQCHICCV